MTVQPEIGSVGEYLYANIARSHKAADEALGWPLWLFIGVLGGMLQPVSDLVLEDAAGRVGYASLFDVDTCPVWALPWLACLRGIALPIGLTDDAALRAYIRADAIAQRGSLDALRAAVAATLTGTQWVDIRTRYDGSGDDARWNLQVRTRASETPGSDATNAAALAAAAYGIGVDYEAITESDYQDIADAEATYTALAADDATYEDIIT